jgi:hypothetical protein
MPKYTSNVIVLLRLYVFYYSKKQFTSVQEFYNYYIKITAIVSVPYISEITSLSRLRRGQSHPAHGCRIKPGFSFYVSGTILKPTGPVYFKRQYN